MARKFARYQEYPDSFKDHWVKALEAFIEHQQFDAGIAYFIEAIDHNPVEAKAHSKLGALYFLKEEFENALKAFLNSLACTPAGQEYHGQFYNVAQAYVCLGDYRNAAEFYDKAIEILERQPLSENRLSLIDLYFYRAHAELKLDKLRLWYQSCEQAFDLLDDCEAHEVEQSGYIANLRWLDKNFDTFPETFQDRITALLKQATHIDFGKEDA